MIVDWNEIEDAWVQAAADAIVATAASNPSERFYAGAFWLLYGDDSKIQPPVFGLNSENWARDVRWHPPDWHWSIIDEAHERLGSYYGRLLALDVDASTYDALWQRHIDVLASASRRLTDLVRSGEIAIAREATSSDFFVGIIDFSQGDDAIDYLNRSVDEDTIRSCGILDQET